MTSKLLNRRSGTADAPRNEAKRGGGYVSEFTEFMDQYLKDHPEVVRDRSVGFGIFWNRKVDFSAQAQAAKDIEPGDAYGFAYSVWSRVKNHFSSTTERVEPASDKTPPPER